MRLLLVGDLHYDLRQFDWVAASAADYDMVVLAGDLLDVSATVPLDAQAPVVLRYLELLARRTVTVVSSGNHDLTGRDEHGEKAPTWLARAPGLGARTDYDALAFGDAWISVCPWWDGPHGRARVDDFLAGQQHEPRQRGLARWIWVYHWPPAGAAVSWTGRRHYGDDDLRGWIERYQPALVLSGHVHQAPLVEGGSWIDRIGRTWILNAGHQLGPRPSFAAVDLEAWSAEWWSYEERGERSLRLAGGVDVVTGGDPAAANPAP